MNTLLAAIVTSTLLVSAAGTERSIDSLDGLKILRAAEDAIDVGGESPAAVAEAKVLYVRAAATEPRLRRSAILGLLVIETDANTRRRLRDLLADTASPMIPISAARIAARPPHRNEDVLAACRSLASWRRGNPRRLDEAMKIPSQRDLLRYYEHYLPAGLDGLLAEERGRRRRLTDAELRGTLRMELSLLGGRRGWAAEAVATNRQPIGGGGGSDIADIMGVDLGTGE